jgi:hypothetical protein
MSPFGLASAGIAKTRTSGRVRGRLSCDLVAPVCDIEELPSHSNGGEGDYRNGIYIWHVIGSLSGVEIPMLVRAKQSWFRHVAFAAAVLATATLGFGAMPRPAAAQYYGYPGYAYPYPYYPYYYPYYAYGYPYWGWGWPYGISVGFGWGGWRGGRGCWNCGFHGGFHGGFGHDGFHGGGFNGGGFHGGGGGGHH